jgi:hypothetical protein
MEGVRKVSLPEQRMLLLRLRHRRLMVLGVGSVFHLKFVGQIGLQEAIKEMQNWANSSGFGRKRSEVLTIQYLSSLFDIFRKRNTNKRGNITQLKG